jgi:PIN domain
MPALVLDAGALIAADRDDRELLAKLRVAERHGLGLRTNGAVIAEVWRDSGGRQARLARLLKAVDVVPVDEDLGRQAGTLLGKSDIDDPVDATVVAIAIAGDRILTSDARDIGKLVSASRRAIHVVSC